MKCFTEASVILASQHHSGGGGGGYIYTIPKPERMLTTLDVLTIWSSTRGWWDVGGIRNVEGGTTLCEVWAI